MTQDKAPSPILLPQWPPPLIGDYVNQVIDVPQWLLKDMLPADSAILMSGRAKLAYKTWLTFLLAICVAGGKDIPPFYAAEIRGLPVLILEAEGGRAQTRNRWLWLAAAYGIDLQKLKNLWFSHRANVLLDDKNWIDKVNLLITTCGIKLVVVDSLALHSRGDENSVKDMTNLMRSFVEFRSRGASVLFLHHLAKENLNTKKERDIDEEVRGTSAIAGFYDTHYGLRQRTKSQKDNNINELTIRSKDDEEQKFEVVWHIDKHAGRAVVRIEKATKERALENWADSLALEMMPGEDYSKSRIEEILGIDTFEVEETITHMVQTNRLKKIGRSYQLLTDSEAGVTI